MSNIATSIRSSTVLSAAWAEAAFFVPPRRARGIFPEDWAGEIETPGELGERALL
jgi:hypothetical protein